VRKAEYQAYLASREWALLKEQVRKRSGGKCERCEENNYEQTHHVTYERAGHEELADLQALCEGCHLFVSGKSDDDPLQATVPNVHTRVDNHGFIRCFCGVHVVMELDGGRVIDAGGFETAVECARGHRFEVGLVFSDGLAFVVFHAEAEIDPTGKRRAERIGAK
jgi:hypothetical protein